MTINRFFKAPGADAARSWLLVAVPSLVFCLTALHDHLRTPALAAQAVLFQTGAVHAGVSLALAVAAWFLFGKRPWIEPVFRAAAVVLPVALIVYNSFGLTNGLDVQRFIVICAPLYAPILHGLSGLGRLLKRPAGASVSFLIAALAPSFLAQTAIVLLTSLVKVENGAMPAAIVLTTGLVCAAFYFFFLRGLDAAYAGAAGKKVSVAALLVFAGLLPLLGLFGFLQLRDHTGGLFELRFIASLPGSIVSGFFIPLLFSPAAGVLLSVQPRGPGRASFVIYLLRLALVPYSLYLLLSALPLLAFAPYLVTLMGMGLAFPLVLGLCVIHARRLADDFRRVKTTRAPAAARVPLLILALFPLLVGAVVVHDRLALAAAHAFVVDPRADSPAPPVSPATIERINALSGRDALPKFVAVIGPLYDALVFGDKPVSREAGELIGEVFLGKPPRTPRAEQWNERNPEWTAETRTGFRPETRDYESTVTIVMKNDGTENNEFVASFTLPPGAAAGGLRLEVGGRYRDAIRVKKTVALFAYESALRRARDPAVLYYEEDGAIRFRVFPFAPRETRRAEIRLLHFAPFALELKTGPGAGRTIALHPTAGADAAAKPVVSPAGTVYLPPRLKASLPAVTRKPYFHFILDVSSGDPAVSTRYGKKIDELLARYPGLAEDSLVSLTGAGVETYPTGTAWRSESDRAGAKTGFNFERALRAVYGNPDRVSSPRFPVAVVLSDEPARAVCRRTLADCRERFPESDDYFWLRGDTFMRRDLTAHPALDDTTGAFEDFRVRPVRRYTDALGRAHHLRDDAEGALVYRSGGDRAGASSEPASASPLFASLEADRDAALLRPARAAGAPADTLLSRDSSLIVLESDKDEEAVLAADRADPKADKLFSMDEPDPLLWVAVAGALLAAAAVVRALARKKNRG